MKEISDILAAYQMTEKTGLKTALATVVHVEGSSYRRPGARMLITENGMLTGAISGGCLEGDALKKALTAIHQQENKLVTYDTTDEEDAKFGVQLGCNGIVHILFEPIKPNDAFNPIVLLSAIRNHRQNAIILCLFSLTEKAQPGTLLYYSAAHKINQLPEAWQSTGENAAAKRLFDQKSNFISHGTQTAFLEFIPPPISLIIVGAGNDAQPLASFAHQLGWTVTVIDGRPSHAQIQRFPSADTVLVAKPNEVLRHVTIDSHTACVLMTHNYNYDIELLGLLLKQPPPYLGTLGPKKKLIRMLEELGALTESNHIKIHGPVGLDIGAETPEEIAISIIAEIKAVFSGATANFLKDKEAPIHQHAIPFRA
ncbi:XdhC family protein [Pedobacter sp. MW01-1-1]|uniref:XdhC family protein n=1 Tax=Pedobacter sp. MW01-1-1 TaxID=3383027 RepID=UPI003FEF8A40